MCVVISSRPMLYQNTKAGVLPASVCPYSMFAERLSVSGVAPDQSVTDMMQRPLAPAVTFMAFGHSNDIFNS